jgi:hypothetical protein
MNRVKSERRIHAVETGRGKTEKVVVRSFQEVGSRHDATICLSVLLLVRGLTVEKRYRRTVGVWRIGRHRSRVMTGVLERRVGPIRGGPGKLGHSGVWNRRARELLLKVSVQLQIEGVSSRIILRQEWLESRRSKGCVHGRSTRVSARLRSGSGRIEHKVLSGTVVVVAVVVLIGSQGLGVRGRRKPWLLLVIRGERRKVERGKVVVGRT